MPNQYTSPVITKLIVEYAKETKALAPEIFRLSAEGMPMAKIADFMNKTMEKADGYHPIANSHVRKILHRLPPFNHPDIFKLVKDEHVRIVESKFRTVRKRRKKAEAPAPVVDADMADRRMEAVKVVYTKRRAYHEALEDAYDLGLSKEAIKSLCDLIDDGCLRQDA